MKEKLFYSNNALNELNAIGLNFKNEYITWKTNKVEIFKNVLAKRVVFIVPINNNENTTKFKHFKQ